MYQNKVLLFLSLLLKNAVLEKMVPERGLKRSEKLSMKSSNKQAKLSECRQEIFSNRFYDSTLTHTYNLVTNEPDKLFFLSVGENQSRIPTRSLGKQVNSTQKVSRLGSDPATFSLKWDGFNHCATSQARVKSELSVINREKKNN